MRLAVMLLLYAGLAGWGVDWLLSRWRYLNQFPRSALYLWHATAFGVLTAVAAALLMLAHDIWEHGLAWLIHADKALIHEVYAGPQEVPQAWNGAIVLLLFIFIAFAILSARGALHARHQARTHQLLTVAPAQGKSAFREPAVGLVDHPAPAVYCVSGPKSSSRILVTSGAVAALTNEQLDAAIEHEWAHLRGRHHAMVVLADSLHRLTRTLGLLRHYPTAVRHLIELAADDVAARRHGRHTVATALLEMCSTNPRRARSTLSWIGSDPASRIRRLAENPPLDNARTKLSLLIGAAVALVTLPLAGVVAPAISLVGSQHQSVSDELPPTQPGATEGLVHHE